MLYLSVVRANNDAKRQRRAAAGRRMLILAIGFAYEANDAVREPYCSLNPNTPVLRLFFGEGDTKKDFRLSRASLNALIQALGGGHEHGWGKALEVGVFVYWLASATSYRVVSEAFDIPRTTIHDVVHRVADGIMGILKRGIHFPSPHELEEIGAGFAGLAGSPAFHHVAGSIDGSHIRIKPPGGDKDDYFNRKLFHSIQLQIISDHNGRILNTYTGMPGSAHDARVLKWSSFYVEQLYPPPGWCIIGDGGYPCLAAPICLMTPFRDPVQNEVQARYNRSLSKARCVVERAFGMMKTRWRSIFLKALEVKSTFAPVVVTCCAFLHNMCLTNGDIVEPEVHEQDNGEDGDEDHQDNHHPIQQLPGHNLLHRLAAAVSAPDAAAPALFHHHYVAQ